VLSVVLGTFIPSAVCLTTGPEPLPKRVLYTVRSSASFSNSQYPVVSLRSSSSCLRLNRLIQLNMKNVEFNFLNQRGFPLTLDIYKTLIQRPHLNVLFPYLFVFPEGILFFFPKHREQLRDFSCSVGTEGVYPGSSGEGMRSITHLYIVMRLGMSGFMPHFPTCLYFLRRENLPYSCIVHELPFY
jgi:hypothetical protein